MRIPCLVVLFPFYKLKESIKGEKRLKTTDSHALSPVYVTCPTSSCVTPTPSQSDCTVGQGRAAGARDEPDAAGTGHSQHIPPAQRGPTRLCLGAPRVSGVVTEGSGRSSSEQQQEQFSPQANTSAQDTDGGHGRDGTSNPERGLGGCRGRQQAGQQRRGPRPAPADHPTLSSKTRRFWYLCSMQPFSSQPVPRRRSGHRRRGQAVLH